MLVRMPREAGAATVGAMRADALAHGEGAVTNFEPRHFWTVA